MGSPGRYNVARSTIVSPIRRVRQTGKVADRPRPGQARVTSRHQDNYIRQRHLRDRFQTAKATASVVIANRGQRLHRMTVSRRLKEFGICCRRPYHGPVLTIRHSRFV